MPNAPRITVDELKRRMEAGEDFTVIDTRNPKECGCHLTGSDSYPGGRP